MSWCGQSQCQVNQEGLRGHDVVKASLWSINMGKRSKPTSAPLARGKRSWCGQSHPLVHQHGQDVMVWSKPTSGPSTRGKRSWCLQGDDVISLSLSLLFK